MPKTVLYIATSLDGYIARTDNGLDWLEEFENSETDYGYKDFISSVGTILMGRKTYETVLGFGIDWPYKDFHTVVVTTKMEFLVQAPNTFLLHNHLGEFLTRLKHTQEKDIWLVGGGELLKTFINENLLDTMILTIIPKLLGSGIPLFPQGILETRWALLKSVSYPKGVINLVYSKM